MDESTEESMVTLKCLTMSQRAKILISDSGLNQMSKNPGSVPIRVESWYPSFVYALIAEELVWMSVRNVLFLKTDMVEPILSKMSLMVYEESLEAVV